MNAILYLNKTSCQWRMLPKDFPPHNTVFYYFHKWKLKRIIEEICDTLHILGIIDSRSIKPSHHVGTNKGISGSKKIKSRKEHIVVDVLGLPIGIVVYATNVYDCVGAHEVIDTMRGKYPEPKILADGGYKGQKLIDVAKGKLNAELEVVQRPDESSKKFCILFLPWIVERSFVWLENFRRIAIDYEFYSDTGVAMVQLAFYKIVDPRRSLQNWVTKV